MKPDKKAYQVNPVNLDHSHESVARGYIYETFHADNEREARKKALRFLDHDCGVTDDYMDNPLTYTSVKVKRYPSDDLFLIDGKLKSQSAIEYEAKKKERDDNLRKILVDNPDGFAMIRKGGYFYRPNSKGYTEIRTDAGIYTLVHAVNECLSCSLDDYMRPEIINIQEHNQLILDKIELLKTQLIL